MDCCLKLTSELDRIEMAILIVEMRLELDENPAERSRLAELQHKRRVVQRGYDNHITTHGGTT